MHFITQQSWQVEDPISAVFDDPAHLTRRWKAIEFPLSAFYYHLQIAPVRKSDRLVNLLVGDLSDAINLLNQYLGSTLSLQTPEWLNNGEPGLYRVAGLYKSTGSERYDIALCSNGKYYILNICISDEDLDLEALEKKLVWEPVIKTRKPRKKLAST